MAAIEQDPVYNMKAVVRETGLTPDTLRAWERRYGIPQPARSEGGHRLYCLKDIESLRWLMARRNEGMSISQAVKLWKTFAVPGLDQPLSGLPNWRGRATESARSEALRDAWVDFCMAFDEKAAEQTLSQAFSSYPVETAAVEVIQKGLRQINDRWYRGDASVQQVYFLSELAARRLQNLLAVSPAPARPERLLMGTPPQEQHTLGQLLLALLLRRQGYALIYLGSDLPLPDLAATVDRARPDLVVLSAQRLFTAATLADTAHVLRETGTAVAYGGRIFNLLPTLRRHIPGHFLGNDLLLAPEVIVRLLRGLPPQPEAAQVPVEYSRALDLYRESRSRLEALARESISQPGLSDAELSDANTMLMQGISAALQFGNMSLVDPEVVWLEGFFAYRQVPMTLLYQYLNAYRRAAEAVLGEGGRPIVAWLAHITGNEQPVPSGTDLQCAGTGPSMIEGGR